MKLNQLIETLVLATPEGQNAPLMLKIIFWLLLILWTIGALGYTTGPNANPNLVKGSGIVLVILFAILGYYTFGF